MVRVLKNWAEVGVAYLDLSRAGMPVHGSPQKNWDFQIISEIVRRGPIPSRAVDLGCSGLFTVKLLQALGCGSVEGLDLTVTPGERLRAIKARWRGRPFRLRRCDITRTPFDAASVDLITCVSVIEHGVPLGPFLDECARLLRPGAHAVVTTDYWHDAIAGADDVAYGMPWKPYDRESLEALVEDAAKRDLHLADPGTRDFECQEPTVYWAGKNFTFAAVVLRKA